MDGGVLRLEDERERKAEVAQIRRSVAIGPLQELRHCRVIPTEKCLELAPIRMAMASPSRQLASGVMRVAGSSGFTWRLRHVPASHATVQAPARRRSTIE